MSIILVEALPYMWHGNPRSELTHIGNLQFNKGCRVGESDKLADFEAEVRRWMESYKTRCKTMVRLEKALEDYCYLTDLAAKIQHMTYLKACPFACVTTVESLDYGYRWTYNWASDRDDGVFWITKDEAQEWQPGDTQVNTQYALGEYSAWACNHGYELKLYDITVERPDLAVLVPEGTAVEVRPTHRIAKDPVEFEEFELSHCIYSDGDFAQWLEATVGEEAVRPVMALVEVEYCSNPQYAILHTPSMPVGGQYQLELK